MDKTGKIDVVPFRPCHALSVEARMVDRGMVVYSMDTACEYAKNGVAYTGLAEDKVIAYGGVINMWEGVGHAWMVTSDLIKKYPKDITRAGIEVLKSFNFHRIQTAVYEGFHEAVKWIEILGFKRECLMEHYGPDKANYYLYVRMV